MPGPGCLNPPPPRISIFPPCTSMFVALEGSGLDLGSGVAAGQTQPVPFDDHFLAPAFSRTPRQTCRPARRRHSESRPLREPAGGAFLVQRFLCTCRGREQPISCESLLVGVCRCFGGHLGMAVDAAKILCGMCPRFCDGFSHWICWGTATPKYASEAFWAFAMGMGSCLIVGPVPQEHNAKVELANCIIGVTPRTPSQAPVRTTGIGPWMCLSSTTRP